MALNNDFYVAGQEGYQDNSAVVPYDPAEAKRELDALGWKLNGQFRERDGRQLVVRDLFYDAQDSRAFAQIAQHSLAQIRVKLELVARVGGGFFTNYINVGAFDIAQFGWLGDAFPLSALTQSPGDIAVRSTLANFGAPGLADLNYTAIGFMRT